MNSKQNNFVFVRVLFAGLVHFIFNTTYERGILLSLVGIVIVAMAKGDVGEHFIWGIALLLIAVIAEFGHASITKNIPIPAILVEGF